MILKLKSALKSYIWGGTKLKNEWHKVSNEETVAESWELSFHKDGTCLIDGGEHDGELLSQVATKDTWGENCKYFEFFPVLNKLIDANGALSIQVHPSDDYALLHEGQFGKTEMWHILDADDGAYIYLGLKQTLTPDEFSKAIETNSICDYLNKVYVHSGETYFIPSGTLHAICQGVMLFEVQQNSSLTYRVYDYDRRDKNGNPRELHIEKAKKVANLEKYIVPSPLRSEKLGGCKYFSAYRYSTDKDFYLPESFISITVVDGNISVNGTVYNKGETLFATAGEPLQVKANGTYIVTCVEKQ